MAGGRPLAEDHGFRERVAALEVELKALELTQMRVIAESTSAATGKPDPKSSILKLKGSELQQAATELLLEVAGFEAMEFDPDFLAGAEETHGAAEWSATIAPNHYWIRHVSIVGGSNEIQRNILATSVLGL